VSNTSSIYLLNDYRNKRSGEHVWRGTWSRPAPAYFFSLHVSFIFPQSSNFLFS
jgi:hypothetical protein